MIYINDMHSIYKFLDPINFVDNTNLLSSDNNVITFY